MRHSVGKTIALVLLILSLASIGWAQYDNSNQNQNQNQNQKSKNKGNNSLDQEKPGQPAGGQAVGKDEAKAYKAFYDARNGDSMKVIELGEGFLAKYPMSLYAGAVYSTLTTAYLNTSQPDKMVTSGQKALEINPDNVDVLPLLAWAIAVAHAANSLSGEWTDNAQGTRQCKDYFFAALAASSNSSASRRVSSGKPASIQRSCRSFKASPIVLPSGTPRAKRSAPEKGRRGSFTARA